MTCLVPNTIQTERLLLRQIQQSDENVLLDYLSDPEAVQYTYGNPLDMAGCRKVITSIEEHWHRRGYGPYALELKKTNEFLGLVGLSFPENWPLPELKWALIRRYWGKGYAKEAAKAIQIVGSQYLPDLDLISVVHSQNTPSIGLASSLGARFEKALSLKEGEVWHVYRHTRVA
ncbi:GNAT family N-acetyltransferase [Photobacterium sp. BZF1]|uniref:GNAT family N-acetyltransferase n=1 Tax=Photobacterium sp. BZF1 TaxID=1904457 RepID=UPI00165386A7|nr:GNAT family N-acetyltransferase [Photobacterium sp. BZF1]MBC7005483.1 GNAT family N-acetyltransferase [Photobacterium sp. BZF1]